jgi:long-chain acyl-CoA synthetase
MTAAPSCAYGLPVHARVRAAKAAMICRDTEITYGAFNAGVNRLACALAARGVEAGGRVAVMLPNAFAFFEATHAAGKLGATVVPVNFHFKGDEIAYIVTDAEARALIFAADYGDEVARAAAQLRRPVRENLLMVGEGPTPAGAARLAGVLAGVPAEEPPGPPRAGFNLMIYTSGTTGRPKGVIHAAMDPEAGYAAQVRLAETWGFSTDDVHLLVGPAYHTAPGAYSQVHLFLGATVVIMPKFDAEEALRLIDRHRVTTTHMVPANFIRILDLPPAVRARYDLRSLRRVLHAAAPCPVDVKRRIMEVFPADAVWEYYGMTEGAGTIIAPDEWRRKPGSVGRPWPGVELAILDEEGHAQPPGVAGLIYVKAAGDRRGFEYHNAPDKTRAAYRGDFFTVGDVGYVDEDGYLFIVDRKADMVISGGVNIYPAEIEAVLHRHPDVVDVAVIGIPDDAMGEQLRAIVELRRGARLTAEDVVAFCRGQLANYKCPKSVEFVAELPRDPNGKVLKRQLREPHWAGRDKRV